MYNEDELTHIWISVLSIGYKKQRMLLDFAQDHDVFNHFDEYKKDILKIITDKQYNELKDAKPKLKKYIDGLDRLAIQAVTLSSPDYPSLLREIDTSPIVLYCKGDVSLLSSECLAIVGTRRATRYGKDVTELFAKTIASTGITIVSGLGSGIDTYAHSSTLEVKGKTIAVLGSGLNVIYPASNTVLAEDIIAKGGLIVSEYKPNEGPKKYYFPLRNRIVAGLSKGVLITEATLNSGSMHTKNYAVEYNRNLYVVPARITDIYSKGCNQVIKNLQGSIVLDPQDILDDYNMTFDKNVKESVQINFEEQQILDILGADELHYEEILSKSSLQTKDLNTLLMKMEIKGLIKALTGNYYSK